LFLISQALSTTLQQLRCKDFPLKEQSKPTTCPLFRFCDSGAIYSVGQKVSPPTTFCNIFSRGKPVHLKFFFFVAQRVYQFWFIYLNICATCVTFTSKSI